MICLIYIFIKFEVLFCLTEIVHGLWNALQWMMGQLD